MRNVIVGILIGIGIMISMKSRFYPAFGIVTEINTEEDTVTVTDGNGYDWQFYGIEDWDVDDYCSMIMFDKFTENITDDVIIGTRYVGFKELFER